MRALTDKIAVITGASRGIGYHAALALAEAGAHVIAVARTVGGLEELDDAIKAKGGSATLVPMDVTDYAAIDRLGAQIDQRWGRLDIFIGNAGQLGGLSPLGHYEPKTFERVQAVNVTANWRFIRSFDPLLKASEAGRAIFVTSGAATSGSPFWGAYAVSKAALDALVRTYAAECASTNVRAILFSPGAVRTAMRAQAMPGEDPQTLPHPSAVAAELAKLALPSMNENGTTFDFTTGKFLTFRRPS